MKREIDDLTGSLLAADIVRQLSTISQAQHRISCALSSDQRDIVLRELTAFGIDPKKIAGTFTEEPLTSEEIHHLIELKDEALNTVGLLRDRVRALAVASTKK